MPKCESCGHVSPAGVELCKNCGASLPRQDFQPEPAAAEPDRPLDESSPQPKGLDARVLAELQAGRKIAAVKLYREATGLGLKAAKDAVEELARRHGIAPARTGCAGVLLLLLLTCTALAIAI
ncbi:MAG: hypothetical protein A2V70_10530 [Planctomycetes bacterium RBG_13_63_9]|nr:MAG: hypothetical protein A2V70_10530 [Planctomycetes bacterium RBG_13_63_9]